ncbi:glycoside hydrolase family 27 protein [Saccharopolyspora erythraea]|uniref:Alpha-galactosidase n=2 Tax=Saccharopolyspora erythraea TaxID=1836 RepID=A4FQA1_SACEN|nr:glycoside hydrolase family 27 protein [Saccharopolyspora erythraea]EQD86322.1 alpha-galactosidase [Saccharopolyspora erythraea D]QRK89740.1 glycoside hydrolase family 27 protein [Saccharopolyspora erythraea]CAM06226.1 putative alpha-galactosidase [Saccharopolyspora erythraea NRRL 2338]
MHQRTLLAGTLLATALLLTTSATAGATSAPEDPAPTPPMGWNSWNKFACDIDERLITETADAMVASGMKDAGYTYVNIDDCWMAPERDAEGRLQADPHRFPSGIKALADHVHAKGLKLGIYSSAGTKTCQGLPASLDHEEIDARSFAEWGVDYLKYDNCNNEGRPAVERYSEMSEALRATGRRIVYSICEWGENDPWNRGRDVGGHLWRTTGDISDSWSSMTSLLDQQVGIEQHSGPGGWNDPDMLEVGNGGMTDTEYRAHFSLWALLNAPLLAGNDLRSMDEPTARILLNPELIAINQDWGGKQGYRVRDDGETEVWAKPVSDGSVAVVLFNRDGQERRISATTEEVGLPGADRYRVRDLWTGDESQNDGELGASVPSHGAVAYRVWAGDA